MLAAQPPVLEGEFAVAEICEFEPRTPEVLVAASISTGPISLDLDMTDKIRPAADVRGRRGN
jgi:hypothetical protein